MADLQALKTQLSALTVLEIAQLTKELEAEWGVSAAAPVAVAAPEGIPSFKPSAIDLSCIGICSAAPLNAFLKRL